MPIGWRQARVETAAGHKQQRRTIINFYSLTTWAPMTMDQEKLKAKLSELRIEHRDLDEVIVRLSKDPSIDQLQIKRLKKRKLSLKDAIAKLESELIPDLKA